jgi:hypothetical protein
MRYRFTAKYRVVHPENYSDIVAFGRPTINAALIVECPQGFTVTAPVATFWSENRWQYNRLFLPGDHIRFRWSRQCASREGIDWPGGRSPHPFARFLAKSADIRFPSVSPCLRGELFSRSHAENRPQEISKNSLTSQTPSAYQTLSPSRPAPATTVPIHQLPAPDCQPQITNHQRPAHPWLFALAYHPPHASDFTWHQA